MATQYDSTFREGQSTIRPPYFDGNDYPYWKIRMRIYLQALDYEIWEIINDGPFMPLTKNEVGEDIPKPSRDWNEFEKRKASLNSKAMNALFCALDKKEFHRVSSCESANEIWHKLEVVYEGTNQVKESKISRYTRQYEMFQMEQNENVYSMYTRFTDIVNTLRALGKTFSNNEKVKKIIRSLPKEWRQKRIAIEEAKDLNVLPIDDLIGSLISYEEDLAAERGNEEKKKNIALKASKHESDEESKLDEEEMDMLARRFRKLFKKSGERRKFRDLKNRKEKNELIKCYECKKLGHIRTECPLLNKLKKKAMVATWDDSDEETSDDEEHQEMTNLALMAIGDESDDDLDELWVLSGQLSDNRIFNSVNRFCFASSLPHNRPTGSPKPASRFRVMSLGSISGLPDVVFRQAVFGFQLSDLEPDFRIFVSQANRQAVYEMVSCCPLTGKPHVTVASGLPVTDKRQAEFGAVSTRTKTAYRIPNPASRLGKILNFALTHVVFHEYSGEEVQKIKLNDGSACIMKEMSWSVKGSGNMFHV
ncbi:hypothetical protein KPL70_015081 [Citrus sinensis]|nr:hypothetical protein KPL70_015081 [Citrus sinensis]